MSVEISPSSFRAAWWLPGPHLQTIWGRLSRPRRLVTTRREVLSTADGDELLLDHLDGPPGSPIVVLLHGLEGSSYSVYIQGLLQQIASIGWRGVAVNFRSCGRHPERLFEMLPNRTARLYHSGETEDFDLVLRTIARREPDTPLFGFGASLGGNVLLKWLGEHPESRLLTAAATLSVPYDLGAGSSHLETFAGGLYVRSFLRTLKRKAMEVHRRFPETNLDMRAVLSANSFRTFDDAATGPLHGFRDADDYYERSSSVHFISRIEVPTLAISADDDPFLPQRALRAVEANRSEQVTLVRTTHGGHVGFVSGPLPWRSTYWGEESVVRWLEAQLDARKVSASFVDLAVPLA